MKTEYFLILYLLCTISTKPVGVQGDHDATPANGIHGVASQI